MNYYSTRALAQAEAERLSVRNGLSYLVLTSGLLYYIVREGSKAHKAAL